MKVILAGYNLDHTLIARFRQYLEQTAAGISAGTAAGISAGTAPGTAAITQAGTTAGSTTAGSTTADRAERPTGPPFRGMDPQSLSPETISAAYARISRDPRPIPDLRAQAIADVAAARKSNQRIIFGFGHASVAEHAVFNLDVLDISRIAMEALEASRLASFTEKSQRYIRLDRDFVVPAEIRAAGLERPFRELIRKQQDRYQTAYERLTEYHRRHHPQEWETRSGRRDLEGAAKEDARYFLSLATTGQAGVTLNARSLEAAVRRLAADPLQECRQLGEAIHAAVLESAPSLVRYVEATEYRRDTPPAIERWVCRRRAAQPGARAADATTADAPAGDATTADATTGDAPAADATTGDAPAADATTGDAPAADATTADVTTGDAPAGDALIGRGPDGRAPLEEPAARLVGASENGDEVLLTALVAGTCQQSWAQAQAWVATLDAAGRRGLMLESLRRLDEHETILRQFELPDLTYELILSASCFAQLKRHRMATLLPLAYDPALGATVPPAFREVNLLAEYRDICAQSESLCEQIRSQHREAAAYILTNGHRRRVIFKVNARELYHLARLRLDAHAQWDIRRLSQEMIHLAQEALPLTLLMAGGKDRFAKHKRRILEENGQDF